MNQESWRAWISVSPTPVSILTSEGQVVDQNAAAVGLFGSSGPLDLLSEADRSTFRMVLQESAAVSVRTPPLVLQGIGSGRRWVSAQVTPVSHEQSAGPGAAAAAEYRLVQWWDSTEFQAEANRLRTSLDMFQYVHDAIVATDLKGIVTYWNPAAERQYGWTREEMMGHRYMDRLPPAAQAYLRANVGDPAQRGEFQGELLDWRRDGSRFWVDARVSQYVDASGHPAGYVGISHDITDRKRAEEELRASQSRLNSILNAIPDIVFLFRDDFTVENVFSSRPEGMDFPPEVYLGRHINDLAPPQILEPVFAAFERVAETKKTEALAVSGVVNGRRRDFDTQIAKDPEGGWIVVVRDVTKAIQEEQELRRRVEQSQRMESLGVMAAGIAQDFNKMLTGVLGFVDLARDSIPPDLPASRYVNEIETATRRAAEMCRQLLAYAGQNQVISRPTDLSSALSEMESLLTSVISPGATLIQELSPGLPAVEADLSQLRQLVINLATNASDAVAGRGGQITVRTSARVIPAPREYAGLFAESATPGTYVLLELQDNGCGMSAATLSRAFDPFFTTKPGGRGLGLAAVLGIVRGHGGLIRVTSEPEQGTVVEVAFPASRLPVESTASIPMTRRPAQRVRKVLAIDDEPALRLLIRTALEETGILVELARSGAEGRQRFQELMGQIDAVVVDLSLPGVSGQELVQEFIAARPELPVIVISGYSAEQVLDQFKMCRRFAFLQKPFSSRDLIAAIADASAP